MKKFMYIQSVTAFWGDERWGSKEKRETCSLSPLHLEEEASFYRVDAVGISMCGHWDCEQLTNGSWEGWGTNP